MNNHILIIILILACFSCQNSNDRIIKDEKDTLKIISQSININAAKYKMQKKPNNYLTFFYPQEIVFNYFIENDSKNSFRFQVKDSIWEGFKKYYSIGKIITKTDEIDIYISSINHLNNELFISDSLQYENTDSIVRIMSTYIITDVNLYNEIYNKQQIRKYIEDLKNGKIIFNISKDEDIFSFEAKNKDLKVNCYIDNDYLSVDSLGLDSYKGLIETKINDYHAGSW